MQQRYVFEGDGADQYCGRTAAGLPLYSTQFTVLPPHFDDAGLLSIEQLSELHVEYQQMTQSFKECMPFLLASLLFHEEWLEAHLHPSHPLFNTFLWKSSDLRAELKEHVVVGCFECPRTGMKATGVPPLHCPSRCNQEPSRRDDEIQGNSTR